MEGMKDEVCLVGTGPEGVLDRDGPSGLTLVNTQGHTRTHGHPG